MVNDCSHYSDTFWFTLFREIGHIKNGDLGLSCDGKKEGEADEYARNALIPKDKYMSFVAAHKSFDETSIREFAAMIERDPAIVFGRLLTDENIPKMDLSLTKRLRHSYNVVIEKL